MERTTEEIVNSLNGCAKSIGCEKCFANWGNPCCISELEKAAADRLVSQQNEIENYKSDYATLVGRNKELKNEIEDLKKQIAETYTAEQYRIDCQRMCESYPLCTGCPSLNECGDHHAWIVSSKTAREWALSHPEKPKVTNGDKFSEVFGTQSFGLDAMFRMIDFTNWLGKEYKEPSDK